MENIKHNLLDIDGKECNSYNLLLNRAEILFLRGLRYGDDMKSSQNLCFKDALSFLAQASVKSDTREKTQRLLFIKNIISYHRPSWDI